MLLLLSSGDINMNSGPHQPKHPCGVCSKAVKWKQQAIECEDFLSWYHKKCINMGDNIFEALQNHESYLWVCCSCGLPNSDSSIFDSTKSFEQSNPYEPSTSNSSLNIPDSENLQPRNVDYPTSSPKGNCSLINNKKRKRDKKTKLNSIKILNVNCQSVRAKINQFHVLLETEKPDIVTGTESWLNSSIASGEIFPPNYQVFRRDRQEGTHGRVFIAITLRTLNRK
ncbi:uncharacterized protein LOC117116516 [Anneissia japonica]|uniref:uncharacterized protein LOC117116516 n=1 Tax=Anneissia japonica TaxID=1529436 RepID=UPI0014255375|nr:uncharacterized protein LOC117116516 [Anneissia japonica]